MNIEDEIFKKSLIQFDKLLDYGFQKKGNNYLFSQKLNDSFRVDILITTKGEVCAKVFDLTFNEEYRNYRIETRAGEFSSTIKAQLINVLMDVKNKCTFAQHFSSSQANRITNLIMKKYHVHPEFLWETSPHSGVFRDERTKKWFGIIMNVDRSKLIINQSGEIDVMNVKLDDKVPKYLKEIGIYPSYHMNKKSWVSIILDDTLPDKAIMKLLDISYNLASMKGEWIVPANPKYYDVIGAFSNQDTILWKQSSNIIVGDMIYIYVAEPISAILFQCCAVETNIAYDYKDDNLSMNKVMKIKLLKKYEPTEFPFKKLKEYGVRAIRGPRSIPKELSKKLK